MFLIILTAVLVGVWWVGPSLNTERVYAEELWARTRTPEPPGRRLMAGPLRSFIPPDARFRQDVVGVGLCLLVASLCPGCGATAKSPSTPAGEDAGTRQGPQALPPSPRNLSLMVKALRPLHEPVDRPQPGDWLVVHDTGAYTMGLWSRHCSRGMPVVLGYRDGGKDLDVLRRKETPEDLVRFWS